MKAKVDAPFVPLNIAVLTVSDTRTLETDTSGQVFVDRLSEAGHHLAARVLLKDDLYKIRPCNHAPWPVWPMARWCAACRVRPTQCVPVGTAFWPSNWMPVTALATLSRT